MTSLTKREMEALLLEHEIAELEGDVEATMATVVPDPSYELAGLGWQIRGPEAVRELYRRILPKGDRDVAAEKRIHAVAENTLLREAYMSFDADDGERVTGLYLVMILFDPETKLIAGERMYMDPLFGGLMADQLGPDFGDVPGVSRISDTAPTIAKHDAYAFAERAGRTINAPAKR